VLAAAPLDVAVEPPVVVPDVSPFADSVVDPAVSAAGFDAPFEVDERSFLAHPEPLKTIAGGAKALRIVPSVPQAGQNCGAGSLTPWRMSVRWPQEEQAYS
jgi:hypothetical protein